MKIVKESIFKGPSKEDILKGMEEIDDVDRLKDIFFSHGVNEHDLDIIKKYLEELNKTNDIALADLHVLMDEAIQSENLEMLELALKYGGKINARFGFGNSSFIVRAVRYKMSPKMVMLMLTYDDIQKDELEEVQEYLDDKELWAEPWQIDELKKIEKIIQKYNPSYED